MVAYPTGYLKLSILQYTPSAPKAGNITDLLPLEVMDPYKPCWCGSGVKWKWCHKDRERERKLAFPQIWNEMMATAKSGFCLHPAAPAECSSKIVRAHTIQRRGGLSAIAEDGHVLSPKEGVRFIHQNSGDMIPAKVGVGTASTFAGFCDSHDMELFRPIEAGEIALGADTSFLLSFRAVAYELFNKKMAEKWAMVQRKADCGLPFSAQAEFQQMNHWALCGTRLAIADASGWKANYDQVYLKQNYFDFYYYAVVFNQILPIVVCGGFNPEFDFIGDRMQDFSLGRPLDHCTLNVTVLNGESVAIFGWLGSPSAPASRLVDSFINISDEQKADSLLRLTFEHIENVYMRPSWWNSLEDGQRLLLIRRMRNGLPNGNRSPSGLGPEETAYLRGYKPVRTLARLQ